MDVKYVKNYDTIFFMLYEGISFSDLRFENDVNMYGIQTIIVILSND